MGAQILVTGATGIVGGEVVRQLYARGTPPIALVHSADKAAALEGSCAEVRVADLRDEAAVSVALGGADKLFMLTPVTPDQVAVGQTLVRLAADAGVQRIVRALIHWCRPRSRASCSAAGIARWSAPSRTPVCRGRSCGQRASCR